MSADTQSQSGDAQSQSNDNDDNGEYAARQPARRAFADEIEHARYAAPAHDGENAPMQHLLPSGDVANRVLFAGVLTGVEDVSNDGEPYLRATVSDPVGTVYAYAGKYSPEVQAELRELEAPEFVLFSAKLDRFDTSDEDEEGDLSDYVVSLNIEWIRAISAERRNRWVLEAARDTTERLEGEQGSENMSALAEQKYNQVDQGDIRATVLQALEEIEDAVEQRGGRQHAEEVALVGGNGTDDEQDGENEGEAGDETSEPEEVAPSEKGVTAIDGVGPQKGESLAEEGIETVGAAAEASEADLAEAEGIGGAMAAMIASEAAALVDAENEPEAVPA